MKNDEKKKGEIKMKKVLITTILIFVILISFLSTNVFAVTVTEESFKQALNNTLNLKNNLVEMDTKNDIIKILETNTNVKYNFNGNPKFTIDLEYTDKMTESECENQNMKLYGLITAFSIVANHFSVEVHDATNYFVSKIVNTKMYYMIDDNPLEEYENAVEFASEILGWDDTFEDELYTVKLNKVLETTENYKVQMILEVNLSGDFSKISKSGTSFEDEMEKNDAILDAADKANKEYEEALKKEQEQLNKFEASLQGQLLVNDLKNKLDVYRKSVQIDNKLYLEYSSDEVYDIYLNMTSNAVKTLEKNTNYFKKSNVYYYDTGRLRTLPIIYYTDTYTSELEVKSATAENAIFDVIIKNIETGKTYKKYTDGLKIVKVDDEWKIDSFKFKDKVEKDDTYPDFVVIEKEEPTKTEDKDENTNKNESTNNVVNNTTNNVVDTTNKVDNVNTENNVTNVGIQDTNTAVENERNKDLTEMKYLLYSLTAVISIVLIYIVYKVVKYSKKDNDNNML